MRHCTGIKHNNGKNARQSSAIVRFQDLITSRMGRINTNLSVNSALCLGPALASLTIGYCAVYFIRTTGAVDYGTVVTCTVLKESDCSGDYSSITYLFIDVYDHNV